MFIGCNEDDPGPSIAPEAARYLDEVLDIMESNSINRLTIDWENFRQRVLEEADGAEAIRDLEPALRQALLLLGDRHSFIQTASGGFLSASNANCAPTMSDAPSLPEAIGYVNVRSFSGNNDAALVYAQEIQDAIRDQDQAGAKGWIIDLRDNPGGNMWPMIAALGPILGDGIAGYFEHPDGRSQSWSVLGSSSVFDGSNVLFELPEDYDLIEDHPKVAVLIGSRTASSGEVVAISFIGRADTRSFGVPTCGLSTSNSQFQLSDGSVLILTTAYLADRDQNKFGFPIPPDQRAAPEDIFEEAIRWLEE